MTKRLILIRHAKSSWNTPLDDHARILNGRGRTSATALGRWLGAQGYVPDEVHTSDAARTLETTTLICNGFMRAPVITQHPALYHAGPDVLMSILHAATGPTVAIVAHNPGIAFFAEQIVAAKPDHARFFDYPTAATLVCDFEIEKWADAVARAAHVVDFIVPRDLEGG